MAHGFLTCINLWRHWPVVGCHRGILFMSRARQRARSSLTGHSAAIKVIKMVPTPSWRLLSSCIAPAIRWRLPLAPRSRSFSSGSIAAQGDLPAIFYRCAYARKRPLAERWPRSCRTNEPLHSNCGRPTERFCCLCIKRQALPESAPARMPIPIGKHA